MDYRVVESERVVIEYSAEFPIIFNGKEDTDFVYFDSREEAEYFMKLFDSGASPDEAVEATRKKYKEDGKAKKDEVFEERFK